MGSGSVFLVRCAVVAAFGACASAQSVETVVASAAPPAPVGDSAFSVVRLDTTAMASSSQLDLALAQVPGLSLFRRNSSLSANPTTQGVSLRSIAPSGAGRALVTLDGVPQNDPFGGWVIWTALPPEDIDAADVVRGAGAGPYGAGALTGVIALKEISADGILADGSGGSLGTRQGSAVGGGTWRGVSLLASIDAQASNGWIPVQPPQAGPADDFVTLDARNASLRAQFEPASGTLISARVGVYRESRHSGLVGTRSETNGVIASITAAHVVHGDELGWRAQVWLHDSDFQQTSATVSPDRTSTTPSSDQYATPAAGWGANAALRGSGSLDWEIGADIRGARGNSHEHVTYVSGAFTQGRISGGDGLVGGLYAEAARRSGGWLLTFGARLDGWSNSNGHIVQTVLVNGATTELHFPSRSGLLPTLRAGVRRDFDNFYLRTAAYEGFRAPSLNELYRPFRQGNNITEANPSLAPEKLYGIELGAGGATDGFSWDVTAFFNRLHAAITNVTVGIGPGVFPGAGFVPAGGLLIQRQNAGDINAPGIEGDVRYVLDFVTLRAAFDYLDQRVHGGAAAPQLTGKRPLQAPRATITGGADIALPAGFMLKGTLRYESLRWADDANTLSLGSAFVLGTRLSWEFNEAVEIYVASDNLLNARVATTATADGIVSYDAPRLITAGLAFRLG
jgi:outer membrane receptor protein involved in Fe transport